MARVGRKIIAEPNDGDQFIYSADLNEFLASLIGAGDGGDAVVHAKTDRKGRVLSVWATATPLPPPVAAPAGPDGWASDLLPAEFPVLPAAPAADPADTSVLTGPATARQVTVGAKHAK